MCVAAERARAFFRALLGRADAPLRARDGLLGLVCRRAAAAPTRALGAADVLAGVELDGVDGVQRLDVRREAVRLAVEPAVQDLPRERRWRIAARMRVPGERRIRARGVHNLSLIHI